MVLVIITIDLIIIVLIIITNNHIILSSCYQCCPSRLQLLESSDYARLLFLSERREELQMSPDDDTELVQILLVIYF